jgi:hypothetical protein
VRAMVSSVDTPALRVRDWGARLPFLVEMGPYRLSVELRERSRMYDRRRLACVNLEDHRIEIRQDLKGLKLAEAFLACLIRLSHFSKGCQQGCVEEAYAHSLATGMVEFALRNPRAWLWFNLLLSEHLPGNVQYDRVVRGALPRAPAMPKRMLVACPSRCGTSRRHRAATPSAGTTFHGGRFSCRSV